MQPSERRKICRRKILTCCRIVDEKKERLSWKSNRNKCAINKKKKQGRDWGRQRERVQGIVKQGKGDVVDVQPCFLFLCFFLFMCQPGCACVCVLKQTIQHTHTHHSTKGERKKKKSVLSLTLSRLSPRLLLVLPLLSMVPDIVLGIWWWRCPLSVDPSYLTLRRIMSWTMIPTDNITLTATKKINKSKHHHCPYLISSYSLALV